MASARKFAERTSVAASKTRAEIERLVESYGAEQFASGWGIQSAVVAFVMHGRQIRFKLPIPERGAEEFVYRNAGARGRERRTDLQAKAAFEAELNRRWRALLLIIKAKLEAVASGIVTFEDEFLAHTVLPNGQTTVEWAGPQVEEAYRIGAMPADLPLLTHERA